jgi:hypothetical protein
MILNSPYISGSLTVTNLSGSGVRYLMTSASGLLISQTADAAIKNTYTASATAGQTVFPVTNGYSTGLVDVYLNGTKLASSDYSDADGVNITLVTGSDAGDLLEFVKYSPALGVTNNALRQLTTFTSSEGQTVYSASYTPGLLDVYYNGSRLTPAEYTANNGTFITLATGSTAGDIIDMLVYSYQVGAFSGVGGTGVANQVAYWSTTNAITGSPNFTVSGSTLAVTGSFTVMTGSAAEFTVNPTGVNIGNALTDSHIISGSLRVNPNGLFISSSGIVGIGTTTPGKSLEINSTATLNTAQLKIGESSSTSKAYLGNFSNNCYMTVGGTFNNGWVLDGVGGVAAVILEAQSTGSAIAFSTALNNTGPAERMRITRDGNVGIGTSSPASRLYVSTTAGATKAYDDLSKTNIMCFDDTSMAAGVGGSITFGGYKTGTSAGGNFAAIDGVKENGTAGNEAGVFRIWTANSSGVFGERMRINSNGYLKIAPNGSYVGSTGGYHELHATAQSSDILYTRHTQTDPYGIEILFSGASPNNTTNWFLYAYDSTNPKAIIYSNGTFGSRTGTYGSIISDIKYKQDITDANSQWDDIKNLRVVNFKFKQDVELEGENALRQIGFIAQEVEQVSPNLVYELKDRDSNETWKSVKTSIIEIKAIKALQEAMARIEELEEKLERNNIQ